MQVFTCASFNSLWCLAETPRNAAGCCGVQRALSRVQVAAPDKALGAVVATASPGLTLAMPKPGCGSSQDHIQHLPAGSVGCGQLLWVL